MIGGFDVVGTDDLAAWSRWLSRLPVHLQDIHFTAGYQRLYEVNGDGQARLFCYEADDTVFLYPFLIRPVPQGLVSGDWFDITSAYGYSGPLSSSNDSKFLAAADAAFRGYCSRQQVVSEFVRFHPLIRNESFLAAAAGMELVHLRDYVAVRVAASVEEQFASYASRNRNSIRKSMKAGVVVQESSAFHTFVSLYLSTMRQLKAAPLYFFSDAFFEALHGLVQTDGFVLTAEHEGTTVGAAVFFCSGEYGHYFLASANPVGRSMAAGNLLLHEGINRCRERGVRIVHLGGGLSGASDDPLLVFKKSFSSFEVPYYIGRRIHAPETYHEICKAWSNKYPDLAARFPDHLQRYRLIPDDHGI